MTLDEARQIVGAYQTRKGQATPAEYLRYVRAREVLAKAGGLQMTAAMRGFLAATRNPLIGTESQP